MEEVVEAKDIIIENFETKQNELSEELKVKEKQIEEEIPLVEDLIQRNIDGPGPAWPEGPGLAKEMMSQPQPEVEKTSSTHRE